MRRTECSGAMITVIKGGVIQLAAARARDIAELTIRAVSLRRMVQEVEWLMKMF
jgi:hypothetical protein